MWPDSRVIELFHIDLPIVQAPMAGACGSAMAIATCRGGGLGSLPCAILDVTTICTEIELIRNATNRPLNVNFFCHAPASADSEETTAWQDRLDNYYAELGVDRSASQVPATRAPFGDDTCEIVEKYKPEIVSFHFGLPEEALFDRVKAAGSLVISTATTVDEARWLEDRGCDAVIAQGYEAGGHRGMFLTDDVAAQPGTLALVPQVVDAVRVPVIAAGGIADGRGIAAAFALGAAAVQIGTAYLFTPESLISDLHRAALLAAREDQTALTNVFSGRPARGLINRVMREVGPISDQAPPFPLAGHALAPLKAKAEAAGDTGFSSIWSGQSARLGREIGAEDLTRHLAAEAVKRMAAMRHRGN